MSLEKAVLRAKTALRPNHPWVYRSQIKDIEKLKGPVVDVYGERGHFVGRGYLNAASEIAVRLLSRRQLPIDKGFFIEKFRQAEDFRKNAVRDTNAYRLVSSEADGLPGLIVDRYGEVLVVQFLTRGMENLREMAVEAMEEVWTPRGIYERSDSSSRRLEGLPEKCGWIRKDCGDAVEVYEKNIRFGVSFLEGHKTGLYLDQRENRLLLPEWAPRGRVLDAFCYEGAFGLHLASAGCRVLGLDSSAEALRRAEANRSLNGFSADQIEFKCANVFDELKTMVKAQDKFDMVILDPPSFVKKKTAIEPALAGYKEILLRAMRLLNEKGLLAVFSCSYHIDDGLLMQTCLGAAIDVKKTLRVLRFMKQSSDHPIDPFVPETYYLKGFLFSVSSP